MRTPIWKGARRIDTPKELQLLALDQDYYVYAEFDYEFPDDVRFPCLPTLIESGGETFCYPSSGRTICGSGEIALALRMGVKITNLRDA